MAERNKRTLPPLERTCEGWLQKSGATSPPNPTIPLLHRSIANPEAMISSAISPPNWSPPNECAVHCRLDEVKKYARRKKVQKEEEEAAKDTTTPSPEPFKACKQCGTSTTPLWRTGPNGPKSLCNACGIKYRKRRRSAERHEEYVKTKPISNQSKAGLEERLKEMQRKKQERMLMLLMEKRWKRREWKKKEAGKDEEAEAALLLMSLSSGILFHS